MKMKVVFVGYTFRKINHAFHQYHSLANWALGWREERWEERVEETMNQVTKLLQTGDCII